MRNGAKSKKAGLELFGRIAASPRYRGGGGRRVVRQRQLFTDIGSGQLKSGRLAISLKGYFISSSNSAKQGVKGSIRPEADMRS